MMKTATDFSMQVGRKAAAGVGGPAACCCRALQVGNGCCTSAAVPAVGLLRN